MMQFSIKEGFHRVARVTGPEHNFLAVNFEGTGDCFVEVLDDICPDGLTSEDINRAVQAGVNRANSEQGTTLEAKQIQYLQSDTRRLDTYELLGYELALRYVGTD